MIIKYIVGVHYTERNKHPFIEKCKVIESEGSTLVTELPREEIAYQIDTGIEFYTLKDGRKAKVIPYKLNGFKFLKTVPNSWDEDNLSGAEVY